MKKSLLCCVVDAVPKFYIEALIWFSCAKKYLPNDRFDFRVYFISGVPQELVEAFVALGASVRTEEPYDTRSPHCNKILPFLEKWEDQYDNIIVTDSDVYIVDDLSPYVGTASIRLAPNNHCNPPLNVFRALFKAAAIKDPPRSGVSLFAGREGGRETYVNNVSGGVMICPAQKAAAVREQWPRWANWLLAHRDLMEEYEVHVDQVSIGLMMEALGEDIFFLPPQVNAILQLLHECGRVTAFHISVGHVGKYTKMFCADGTLDSTNLPAKLAPSLLALNDAIIEGLNQARKLFCTMGHIHTFHQTGYDEWGFRHHELPNLDNSQIALSITKVAAAKLRASRATPEEVRQTIERSGLFLPEGYLEQYPDVAAAGVDPLHHFIRWGAAEGRQPFVGFDVKAYRQSAGLMNRPDINPLYHYIVAGQELGLRPGNSSVDDEYTAEQFNQESSQFGYEKRDPPIAAKPAQKLICFYLPQFHQIPENDEWWGQGFTEWTHVRSGSPQFPNHDQPRVPVPELGYYELTNPEVIKAQAALARSAGIHGMAFYYYYFADRRILDKPLDLLHQNPDIDLPYCVFWANHPWTRRWYGQEREILLPLDYSLETMARFIKDTSKYFSDPRYIRVNGKPVLMMLHWLLGDGPKNAEECRRITNLWRQYCRTNGIGEIYLLAAQLDYAEDKRAEIDACGFDGLFEFAPTAELGGGIANIAYRFAATSQNFSGSIRSYGAHVARRAEFRERVKHDLLPCVLCRWDNTARYDSKGQVFVGATPDRFEGALRGALQYIDRRYQGDEKIVFINGWNEWSEGAYLEPDQTLGYSLLNRVQRALLRAQK